jgi:uncharacterized protein (DUF433 family)
VRKTAGRPSSLAGGIGRAESRLERGPDRQYPQFVIAASYRYIVRRARVRSGHPVVEGTRIGVHDVVALVRTGATVDEVVSSFPRPRLTRGQVYECLAYYEDHQAELESLVSAQTAHLDE